MANHKPIEEKMIEEMESEAESNGEGAAISAVLVKPEPKTKPKVKNINPKTIEMRELLDELSEHLRHGRYVKAGDALRRAFETLDKM